MRLARTERGFTLVELMVALVVLTAGLFAIIHMQVVTIRGHSYAREREEAYQIAQGIAENLRTRSLEWLDLRDGMDKTFADVFPEITLITPPPLAGTNIDMINLRSMQEYAGTAISADGTPQTASPINVFGRNPTDNPGLPGARGAYRVHYIAYAVPYQEGQPPDGSLIRVTIFVSWESKDHGADVDWSNWWNGGAAYWDRHIVSVTTYLKRHRKY
jgi:prepilin-type N-terminal cleavage/methylation domain-containing protein